MSLEHVDASEDGLLMTGECLGEISSVEKAYHAQMMSSDNGDEFVRDLLDNAVLLIFTHARPNERIIEAVSIAQRQ